MKKNVDSNEIARFNKLAAQWWDTQGDFRTLHHINPVRLDYIVRNAGNLKNKSVLDVGCGGGILAESMAQCGAKVTAIDMAPDSIAAAQIHAREQSLEIDYQRLAVEDLAVKNAQRFDVVTCMELLEHVPKPDSIVSACAALCKPGGHIVFSTISRTLKAFTLAIVAAEYLLRLLPSGTHEYEKFIRPSELAIWSRRAGLEIADVTGIHYNPLTHNAALIPDVSVNYLMHTRRIDD